MQAAILISQAIVIGMLVVGGFWLRTIVRQQLAAKDATAEALRTENDRLRSLAAPSLVAEIERLSRFAEGSQRTVNSITEELNKLKTAGVSPAKAAVKIEQYFDAIVFGIGLISDSLTEVLDKAGEQLRQNGSEPIIDALTALIKNLIETTRTAVARAGREALARGAKYVVLE